MVILRTKGELFRPKRMRGYGMVLQHRGRSLGATLSKILASTFKGLAKSGKEGCFQYHFLYY